MSEIESIQQAIDEEALPKSKAIKQNAEKIVETSQDTASHLARARKGIEEHVLPHLMAAIGNQEAFQAHFMGAAQDMRDVRRVARTVLGDKVEFSEFITSTIRGLQSLIAQDTRSHIITFGLMEEDVERLKTIDGRLELTIQHFSNAAYNTSGYIAPLGDIIDRLENFEV